MENKKTIKAVVKFKDITLYRDVRRGCEEEFRKLMYDKFGNSCYVVFVGEENEKSSC